MTHPGTARSACSAGGDLNDVESILCSLERAGVRYCVIHGGVPQAGDPESDVDLAVHPSDTSLLLDALEELHDFRLIQSLAYESTSRYLVLASADGDGTPFVRLDISTDFRRDRRIFLTADQLLAGRRRDGPIWAASASTEFSYLLVKKTLKGSLPDGQRERLAVLAAELGAEAAASVGRLFGADAAARAHSLLAVTADGTPAHSLSVLRGRLLSRSFLADPLSALRYAGPELWRLWRRLRQPTGVFVAVLGPDGAGKSTLIRRLGAAPGAAFRRCDTFHLRAPLRASRAGRAPERDPHRNEPYGRMLSFLKILHFAAAYWLGHYAVVRPRLVRSSLVLFDRCYLDLLVDPRRHRYGGPLRTAAALGRVMPRPDLLLVLDAPAEQLAGRKDELSLEELQRQRAGYRDLASRMPGSFLIDASLSEDEVARAASSIILDHLRGRFRSRAGTIFPGGRWRSLRLGLRPLAPDPAAERAARPSNRRRHGNGYGVLAAKDGRVYLVPLRPPNTSARALAVYNAQSFTSRAGKAGLATALRCGLGGIVLPRTPDGSTDSFFDDCSPLAAHLQSVLGCPDARFAFSLGAPGAHRKPVIEVMNPAGRPLAWAKIGWNPATKALVSREAETMRYLGSLGLRRFAVPQVIHFGPCGDLQVLVESASAGRTARAPRRLESPCASILAELGELNRESAPLAAGAFWKDLTRSTGELPDGPGRGLLARGMRTVESLVGRDAVPLCFSHGDFAPWNMVRADGQILLFDWEYASRAMPPGFDAVHFLVQTGALLEGRSPAAIARDLLESDVLRRVAGASDGLFLPLLLLALMGQLKDCARGERGDFASLQRLSMILQLFLSGEAARA